MQVTLAVAGMTCDGCVRAVTRVLERQAGVARVGVDLAAGRATVEGDAAPAALVAAVENAGYAATVAER